MVIKLSMYVALHDVYPAMKVNIVFKRKLKMTTTCNFVSLGDKMRELLVKIKKGKERKRKRKVKEKRKLLIT